MPPMHALPLAQRVPQPPQLRGSVVASMQAPPQQSGLAAGQSLDVQH
jgi:hypothetical protein